MKKIALICAAVTMLLAPLFCQDKRISASLPDAIRPADPFQQLAPPEIDSTGIILRVRGLMNVAADQFVATFNIVQLGETPEQASALAASRIGRFAGGLARIGVDTSSLGRDLFSFQPKYDYHFMAKMFTRNHNQEPDAFEVQENVSVHCRKREDLARIVVAAAQAEIFDLVKSDYFVEGIEAKYDSLRLRCLSHLRSLRKTYEGLGVKLDSMRASFADQQVTVLPKTRYETYRALTRPSMDALKRQSAGPSKIADTNSPATRYYEPLGYNDFHVVINPVIDGPVVQLTYQLVVRYYHGVSKDHPEYYVVTPAGEAKLLRVSR